MHRYRASLYDLFYKLFYYIKKNANSNAREGAYLALTVPSRNLQKILVTQGRLQYCALGSKGVFYDLIIMLIKRVNQFGISFQYKLSAFLRHKELVYLR